MVDVRKYIQTRAHGTRLYPDLVKDERLCDLFRREPQTFVKRKHVHAFEGYVGVRIEIIAMLCGVLHA